MKILIWEYEMYEQCGSTALFNEMIKSVKKYGDKIDLVFNKQIKNSNLYKNNEKIICVDDFIKLNLDKYDVVLSPFISFGKMIKDGVMEKLVKKLCSHNNLVDFEQSSYYQPIRTNVAKMEYSALLYDSYNWIFHHNDYVDVVNEKLYNGKIKTDQYWFGLSEDKPPKDLKSKYERSKIIYTGYFRGFRKLDNFIEFAKKHKNRLKDIDFEVYGHTGGFSCMKYEKHNDLINCINKNGVQKRISDEAFIKYYKFLPREEIQKIYKESRFYWSNYDYSKHSKIGVKLEFGQLDSMFAGCCPIFNTYWAKRYIHNPFAKDKLKHYVTVDNFLLKDVEPYDISNYVCKNYNFDIMYSDYYRERFKNLKNKRILDIDEKRSIHEILLQEKGIKL